MSAVHNTEFYRLRAAEMREQADKAQNEELRASYLMLAAHWTRLAEQAENTPETEAPQPKAGPAAKP